MKRAEGRESMGARRTRDSRAHAGATLAAAATLLSTGGAGAWGTIAKIKLAGRLFQLARRYPLPAVCIGAVVVALWATTHHARRRDGSEDQDYLSTLG